MHFVNIFVMMLINILLLFSCAFVYGKDTKCDICIIDSSCDDDYVHFNISISEECPYSMILFYNYDTDIDSERHHSSVSTDCQNCYFDLTIDLIRDAWDYTLTIESPKLTGYCSTRIAHCGGKTSWLVWIVTASLSGLFILSGFLLCLIRSFRIRKQRKTTQKKIDASVINS